MSWVIIILASLAILLVVVLVSKRVKIASMMTDKSNKLKSMADSWKLDTPVTPFDTSSKVTEEAFKDMQGQFNRII